MLKNMDLESLMVEKILGQSAPEKKIRILVSGATGFVGRHVVSELLKNGHEVSVLARNLDRATQLFHSQQVDLYQFNIASDSLTDDLKKFEVLVHCAWDSVTEHDSIKHVEEHFWQHYLFLKSLIKSEIKKLIITGSCYEYGCQFGPISVSMPTNPNTAYGLGKDMLHNSLRLLKRNNEFELVWARLFFIYGHGQNPNSVVPLFDQALDRGDQKFNMSGGEQIVDYISVEQAAQKLIKLIDQPDGIYNVCSGQPISLRKFLEKRMAIKNKNIELNLGYYEYRKNDPLAMWGVSSI